MTAHHQSLLKNKPFILMIFVLLIATLACSLGQRGEPLLGETYQSDQGGFITQQVLGYTFEAVNGHIVMIAQDADAGNMPFINLSGAWVEGGTTPEELLGTLQAMDDQMQFRQSKKATVDGVDGLVAELSGDQEGVAVKGKVFVAVPSANQVFIMVAIAPEARWKELSPIFDALLESLEFIDAASQSVSQQPFEPFQQAEPETPAMAAAPVEIRQWAVTAEASSEYTSTDWSAMQATGAPDVEICGDDPNAWASRYSDTEDYLVLKYETPVNPTELVIYQTYNPSQVVEIQFIDVTGETWMLWYGDPVAVDCPDVWTHTIELDEVFYSDTVVIFIDQSMMGWGWAEIDAVELVGYPQDAHVAQVAQPVPTEEDAPQAEVELPATDAADIPTNYSGLMAGPIYQGWVSVTIGETMEADLDRIMSIGGRKSTDSWKPRDSHAQTYLFDMPWEGMTGFISVTTEGWVYKKNVSSTAHPDDFALSTVTRETYEELKAIYDRDKVIPYAVMANILESPGFLREEFIGADDGKIRSTYNWYNAAGDRITGIFIDGKLTGMMGLNFITAE